MKLPLLTIQFRNKRKIRSKRSERHNQSSAKNFLLIYQRIIIEKQPNSIGFYEPGVSRTLVVFEFEENLISSSFSREIITSNDSISKQKKDKIEKIGKIQKFSPDISTYNNRKAAGFDRFLRTRRFPKHRH